jgi:N-acetylglutamate synthase-like GNAT family acetyltransferase/DNA-binding transcriptional ArsR family regulator
MSAVEALLDIESGIWQINEMINEKTVKVLANRQRLQVLDWLKDPRAHFREQVDGDLVDDGVCGLLIAEKLGLTASTLSEHMRLLVDAGLVTPKKIKQWIFYRRDEAAITAMATQLSRALLRDSSIDYSPDLELTAVGERPITIARYADLDRDAVAELIVAIQREEFSIPITLDDQPDLLDIPGYYQVGAGDFWVARHGQRVVGTIGLRQFAPGAAALRKMFVIEMYRGKAGVASRLLSELLEAARARGLRQIFLGTTAAFAAAHRFYEKHGFAVIAEGALPADFPRMAVDTKFYVLDLHK